MPVTIDDACDMLRGRVRRLTSRSGGREGSKRLTAVAKDIGISGPILINFMNGIANPTIDTLRLIEVWCDSQEKSA